ncbi:MAG: TerB family tellurite resistance protein [Calditrichaeota bacterium]|nr:MAG: TerB family tellurite resistance protein [Calditrichota bacterium]
MDKFQAIFEILYFMAAVDGDVDPREIDVINTFLDANYGNVNFDAREVAASLMTLTADGMVEELTRAAIAFKNSSTAKDRTTVLDFALQLIAADGRITESERKLFLILGSLWNIDMPSYLASKGL